MNILKTLFLLFLYVGSSTHSFGQTCDCESNFLWVKKTFEDNDAGFSYVLKDKGSLAYKNHNKNILDKIKSVETLEQCETVLSEWLAFFRTAHVYIQHVESKEETHIPASGSEAYHIDTHEFKKYLDTKGLLDYEGIWELGPYHIGIKNDGDTYIGFIVESEVDTGRKGQIKLILNPAGEKDQAVFYSDNNLEIKVNQIELIGENLLQIGKFTLTRLYPDTPVESEFEPYIKLLNAKEPYIDQLNETTLYFRIPSFQISEKPTIDSLININRNRILSTKNLIIDIRNGTGGSDASYREILPLLYTNPIRTMGVEYLSTKINNQRMLDFIDKPEWGMDEAGQAWARKSFEILENSLGEFVNLNENRINVTRYDTVYTYPQSVGIIVNKRNGSTDEQFLLAAKQSKKVKLFGTTTYGVLDISNMHSVISPCGEFKLGYSLSRSTRVPGYGIDGHGIQPDFYIDKSIQQYQWVDFVDQLLNE